MEEQHEYRLIYLEQEGLIVRAAIPGDAALICEYFVQNRDFLKPWEPAREAAFFVESMWAQKLIKLHELHKMGLGFYLLIIDQVTDQMVGTVSFSNLTRYPFYACTVGYSLAEHAQGKGIMHKALRMACDYMFKVQNMHRIQAAYMPKNQRSKSVLERMGFQHEGFAEDYLLIDGQWQDHQLTSLLNPNWKPV